MNPAVSIVVAVKDSLPRVRAFVDDFRRRRPARTNLVVVDGGSADGTAAWLEADAPGGQAAGIRWISRPDSGIAEAWNRGIARADGDWILFLGCDDQLGEQAAWQSALAAIDRLPGAVGVAALPVEVVAPSGAVIDTVSPRLGKHNDDFLAVNTIPHQGVFHRRRLWQTFGPFDPAYRVACDYEFLLRVLVAGEEIRVIDGPAAVRMTFGGLSKRDPLGNLREFRMAQIRHGVRRFRPAWWTAWGRAVVAGWLRPLLGAEVSARLADRARRLRGLPEAWTVR